MVSVVRCGCPWEFPAVCPDGVVDSSRSVEPDEAPSEKRTGELHLCVFFGKAYTSQVLPFGEIVMCKYTAVPISNLDQRWGHGIWVGKAPMTDEHILLTEKGVQKARSLHRVPPGERFVISELKKVRGLPWNSRAENLKATNCNATGPRPIWTSTCVLDDQGRGKAWCNAWLQRMCRFGTAHRRMSSAIGKSHG